jgi:predicted alpha/beta-fold hydrolase
VDGDLFGLGFSLGGNILTNYLADQGEACLIKAAMAVCNPFCFSSNAETIDSTLFGLYGKGLVNNLK